MARAIKTSQTNDQHFPVLKGMANVYKGIATLIMVIVVIGGGIGTLKAVGDGWGTFFSVVLICLSALGIAGFLKLMAELISLFLAIEENTRLQKESAEKLVKLMQTSESSV